MVSIGLLIAAIALTGRDLVLCVVFDVLRQRASDIDDLIELPFTVAPYVALVAAGVDQLSPAGLCLVVICPPLHQMYCYARQDCLDCDQTDLPALAILGDLQVANQRRGLC